MKPIYSVLVLTLLVDHTSFTTALKACKLFCAYRKNTYLYKQFYGYFFKKSYTNKKDVHFQPEIIFICSQRTVLIRSICMR